MNILNKKAVLFDLDGTLIDTEKIYRQIWPKAIADMGHVLTDDMYLSLRSLGRPFAPRQFKDWFGEDFDYDGARKIRKTYFDAYKAEHGIQLKKGAKELLTHLNENGVLTVIVTATDIVRAQEYLEFTGLAGYFKRIVSATMVDEGKPSPKVYEYAVKELGLDKKDCVAVEDAPNGVRSAYGAGLDVIMVPDLTGPDEEISKMLYFKAESLLDLMA